MYVDALEKTTSKQVSKRSPQRGRVLYRREMAAVRALLETSVPRWSWNWTWQEPYGANSHLPFVVSHDRSIDVILNNQRGEGFVKQVFLATLAGCTHSLAVLDIGT